VLRAFAENYSLSCEETVPAILAQSGFVSAMACFRKLTFQSRIEFPLCELRKCRLGSLSPAFCY
jgi:hypothetical protein